MARSVPAPPDPRHQKLNRCLLAGDQVRMVAEEALWENDGLSFLLILGKSRLCCNWGVNLELTECCARAWGRAEFCTRGQS